MNIEFKNTWAYMAFRDDGIIFHGKPNGFTEDAYHRFIPYESISKIGSTFGCLTIEGKNLNIIFPYEKADKKSMKEMIAYAKNHMVVKPFDEFYLLKPIEECGEVDVIDKDATEKFFTPKLCRLQCKKCGHIIYYTIEQLEAKIEQSKKVALNAMVGYAGALSGNYAASAVYNTAASNEADKSKEILDLEHCPKCYSKELERIEPITMDEYKKIENAENKPTISNADEIKKFKELLDMGVITEEEFNAKKKELLGL